MRSNYHTHSTWCDGRDSPEAMVCAALARGFGELGFSSHAMLPRGDLAWTLTREKLPRYAAEIRELAQRYDGRIRIFCGVEADYIPGACLPDRSVYASVRPDYVIGSVHWVRAADGTEVPVDDTPDALASGIRDHFGGSAERFVRAYFSQVRDMVAHFDFDIVGHVDLVRKFNVKRPYFDENAAWYLEETARTAEALAASGKVVEINTGAISRGWLDDAYPAAPLRSALRDYGVALMLSSDAHAASAIDCAFDRLAGEATV